MPKTQRNDRKKLEEVYEDLKNEVMELSPERQEIAIQKLQDEIKECKAILKCGVCFDRPKEVKFKTLFFSILHGKMATIINVINCIVIFRLS